MYNNEWNVFGLGVITRLQCIMNGRNTDLQISVHDVLSMAVPDRLNNLLHAHASKEIRDRQLNRTKCGVASGWNWSLLLSGTLGKFLKQFDCQGMQREWVLLVWMGKLKKNSKIALEMVSRYKHSVPKGGWHQQGYAAHCSSQGFFARRNDAPIFP